MSTSTEPSPLIETIGPVYTLDGIARALHIGAEVVDRLRDNGELLFMQTADGVDVAPAYQINQDSGTRIGYFGAINRLFKESEVDGWVTATWFVMKDDDLLEGKSPIEWLKSGKDLTRLKQYAGQNIRRYVG